MICKCPLPVNLFIFLQKKIDCLFENGTILKRCPTIRKSIYKRYKGACLSFANQLLCCLNDNVSEDNLMPAKEDCIAQLYLSVYGTSCFCARGLLTLQRCVNTALESMLAIK